MVSLVTTVLNDCTGTKVFFNRMAEQTRPPDEIVIVDSFSKDGTWELLLDELVRTDRPWKIIAWQERCNVAMGRNLAITAAHHEIIASTDIGCDWDPQWLEELVAPLFNNPNIEVVIGSWAVPKEWAVSPWARTEFAFRPSMKLEATPASQGTSRSIAYRKSAWAKLGGYPEDLTLAADDTCFDRLIKNHSLAAGATPHVRCYWHRHSQLRDFLKEEYRNFFGDGEAAINHKHFVLVGGRLGLEALAASAFIVLALFPTTLRFAPFAAIVALVSVGARLRRLRSATKSLQAEEINHPWPRLIAFEYLTKLYGLTGYARGFLRGQRHCTECRRRLAQPTNAPTIPPLL